MTKGQLTKPLNHNNLKGQPMLFASMPKAKLKTGGNAKIQYNIMTGSWMVDGQNNSPTMYAMPTLSLAIRLAKTINNYNETGVRGVTFKAGKISELVLVE